MWGQNQVSVRELADFIFPSSCKNRILTVLGASFDESQDDKKKKYLAIAGWIANSWDWVPLINAWHDCLERYSLEYFRSADCENGTGPFAQFRDDPQDVGKKLAEHEKDKLRDIKTQFVDVCLNPRFTIAGVGAVVLIDDYNALVATNGDALRLFGTDPYSICFQASAMEAGMLVREANRHKKTRDMMGLVFDRIKGSRKWEDIYDEFQAKNPEASEYMASLTYADKTKVESVQVADLLAYECYKYLRNSIEQPEREIRKSFVRMAGNVHKIFRFDRKALELVLAHQTTRKPLAQVAVENFPDDHKMQLIFDLDF